MLRKKGLGKLSETKLDYMSETDIDKLNYAG
jgi:hypothetical protein